MTPVECLRALLALPLVQNSARPLPEPWASAERIVGAASVTGWRPIESAPRDGTLIICAGRYPNGVAYVDTVFWAHEHWWGHKTDAPTYWQPLPSPPLSAKDTSDGKEIPGNPKLNNAEPPTSPSDSAEGE
jgi:hypothetical protein